MATRQFDCPQNTPKHAITQSVGGAISDDVRVIISDTVSRRENIMQLEKIIELIMEGEWAGPA